MRNDRNPKNTRRKVSDGLLRPIAIWGAVSVAFMLILSLSTNASRSHLVVTDAPSSFNDGAATVTVTVTNASDVVNGDVSSIQALLANPGPDGISFREALVAANNTSAPKAILFDPTLKGATITIAPDGDLLLLASGYLTITGDITNDGQPDITLDGQLGECCTPSGPGLSIVSSNNTIKSLKFAQFAGPSIQIVCPDSDCGTKSFVNNRILDNVISSPYARGISITPLGLRPAEEAPHFSDIIFRDILISGNTISTTESALYIHSAEGGGKRNQVVGVTVSNNRLTSSAEVTVDFMVADVNSAYFGLPGPIEYSEDNLIQSVTISDNHIEAPNGFGIHIIAANYGNQDNQLLDLAVVGNTVTKCRWVAINLHASDVGGKERGTNNNLVRDVIIQGNTITDVWAGITIGTSHSGPSDEPASQNNRVENVVIDGNSITDFSNSGIALSSGGSNGSLVKLTTLSDVVLSENTLRQVSAPYTGTGIRITGGYGSIGPVVRNTISGLSILANQVSGTDYGLSIYGGVGSGAEDNQVLLDQLSANALEDNSVPEDIRDNVLGASGNVVTFASYEYALDVRIVGQGTVSKEPNQPAYHYGDVVTLTATAHPDWTFVGWSGDVDSKANPLELTMEGDTAITATFEPREMKVYLPLVLTSH